MSYSLYIFFSSYIFSILSELIPSLMIHLSNCGNFILYYFRNSQDSMTYSASQLMSSYSLYNFRKLEGELVKMYFFFSSSYFFLKLSFG